MRARLQLIACFLCGAFILAGALAFSPELHWLIEHGGEGRPHTHLRPLPASSSADPAEPDEHPSPPGDSNAGHQHGSLAETLAHGTVECPADSPLPEFRFQTERAEAVSAPAFAPLDWSAHAPTRAPPRARG